MGEDAVVISIFMALEGVHAYSAFLPSVFTIKTFVKTENGRSMIREGEMMASLFLIALALATSKLTKSWWPAIFAGIAGGSMVAVYEYALYRAPVNTGVSTDADFTQPPTNEQQSYDNVSPQYGGLYKITR